MTIAGWFRERPVAALDGKEDRFARHVSSPRHATAPHLGCEIVADADDEVADRHQPRSAPARAVDTRNQLVAEADPEETRNDGAWNRVSVHDFGIGLAEQLEDAEKEQEKLRGDVPGKEYTFGRAGPPECIDGSALALRSVRRRVNSAQETSSEGAKQP